MALNKQGKMKLIEGVWRVIGGIEWLKVKLADGNERRGFSWNVVGGCKHRCEWVMPNGQIAGCYAKDTAEGIASAFYPKGFEHHYFHPERLTEPLSVKVPSRFFPDSMADLVGNWVPDEEVRQVASAMNKAHWHTFLLLTKNPVRYRHFWQWVEPHVWLGASTPPDHMWGKVLSPVQQTNMLIRTLETFDNIPRRYVKWLSVEPLSWDVAPLIESALKENPRVLQWMVIGAASNGTKTYQPEQAHLDHLLRVADQFDVPVFFKGNLSRGMVNRWREDFPHEDPLKGLAA